MNKLYLVLDDNFYPPEKQIFKGKFLLNSKEITSVIDEFNSLDLGGNKFEEIKLKRAITKIHKIFGCKKIIIKENK
jgi:hypothetical protein